MVENPTGQSNVKMIDKILRMKEKQVEQYVRSQRRKHGTDESGAKKR